MATRNQRKAKAKARAKEIAKALSVATVEAKVEIWKPKQDVYEVPQAIRGHREATERHGKIVKGKFLAKPLPIPAKRTLVFHPLQNREIEKRKRYI